eukprot:TRINITY_DN14529_c0_g1_i1.p3 TRINITY_DN14529_c0_g1~~TRINITY_DN14529_c0_g1_i1.p3  ORF type:complete len:131 (-),score=26.23 TRINITY_DN14529_c0_g1_i1:147-539(-)
MYAIERNDVNSKQFADLKLIPLNFGQLFRFGQYRCKCHRRHMTLSQILEHQNMSLDDFMRKLVGNTDISNIAGGNNDGDDDQEAVQERIVKKKRKMKCDEVRRLRRENERGIKELLSQAETIREEPSGSG